MPQLSDTWIGFFREFLATFQGSINITDAWILNLQRVNYSFIMDDVLDKHPINKPPQQKKGKQIKEKQQINDTEVKHVNMCRLYPKVMFLSDITNPYGTKLLYRYLTPGFQNDSKWNWPDPPPPIYGEHGDVSSIYYMTPKLSIPIKQSAT